MKVQAKTERSRRSEVRQRDSRVIERSTRIDALVFVRWCKGQGLSYGQAAAKLGVSASTLQKWRARWRESRLEPSLRGRPMDRPSAHERNYIISMFALMGPGLGVPTLAKLFPETARRELEDIARRYRFTYRRNRSLIHCLRWNHPGRVWAMDFTHAPLPIDGTYPLVLLVRDLASGKQLLALPAAEISSKGAHDALLALFMRYGGPLVVKSDNDAAFTADEVKRLLARWRVTHLLSPPATPEYNGACEAGVGSLKARAHHESARHGRPGEWTCDDVEAARAMANETARPWGRAEPHPNEAWDARLPLYEPQRDVFIAAVERLRKEETQQRFSSSEVTLSAFEAGSIDRIAIGRALIECDYLELRRRWVSPPIFRRRPAGIT